MKKIFLALFLCPFYCLAQQNGDTGPFEYATYTEFGGGINVDTLRKFGWMLGSDVERSLIRKGWRYDTLIIESGYYRVVQYQFNYYREGKRFGTAFLRLIINPENPNTIQKFEFLHTSPNFMSSFSARLEALGFKGEIIHKPDALILDYMLEFEACTLQNFTDKTWEIHFMIEYAARTNRKKP